MIRVQVLVDSEDQAVVTRAIEVLSRAVTGLALEGVQAALGVGTIDENGNPL